MASDWEFIFDGVFGYLSSPLWMVPIMSFIDSESIVFEPSEENHLSWTEVHNRYKKLVESLLESYLKDVGISEEQFMRACTSSSAQRVPSLQIIQEQLFAADNFEIFKRLMVQRNVELQLEALEMIQKRQGKKGSSKPTPKTTSLPSEDEILQAVLKQSEMEYKQSQEKLLNEANSNKSSKKPAAKENPPATPVYDAKLEADIVQQEAETQKLVEDVLIKQEETKKSVNEVLKNDVEESTKDSVQPSQTEAKKEILQPLKEQLSKELSKENQPNAPEKISEPSTAKSDLPPLKVTTPRQPAVANVQVKEETKPPQVEGKPKQKEEVYQKPPQAASVSKNANELNESEIVKRTEYLKQQRDRLLALKKQQREKQLDEYTKEKPERPKSAKVAAQAVAGNNIQPVVTPSSDDAQKLAMRKALAAKLKREVVNR